MTNPAAPSRRDRAQSLPASASAFCVAVGLTPKRYNLRWDARPDEEPKESWCNDVSVRKVVVAVLAQVAFTFECAVKILAEGYDPSK